MVAMMQYPEYDISCHDAKSPGTSAPHEHLCLTQVPQQITLSKVVIGRSPGKSHAFIVVATKAITTKTACTCGISIVTENAGTILTFTRTSTTVMNCSTALPHARQHAEQAFA